MNALITHTRTPYTHSLSCAPQCTALPARQFEGLGNTCLDSFHCTRALFSICTMYASVDSRSDMVVAMHTRACRLLITRYFSHILSRTHPLRCSLTFHAAGPRNTTVLISLC